VRVLPVGISAKLEQQDIYSGFSRHSLYKSEIFIQFLHVSAVVSGHDGQNGQKQRQKPE
jgi:hypothetical protein